MSVVVGEDGYVDVHVFGAADEIDESAQLVHTNGRALSAPEIAMTFAKRINAPSHSLETSLPVL
jgi:hypothetical protein